ncbi:MAG: hypothetical protein M3Y64_08910 [Gemmatimonadota bacterium]|nr:hypothetical protein [Gemmatimonadota bacterium]
MRTAIHYLPIATTIFATFFCLELIARFRAQPERKHYLWWALGVAVYGAGTLTESLTTLIGWHSWLFRAWYITGALLGGAPLAQGSVYLLLRKRTADILSLSLVAYVTAAAICVILSPLNLALVEPHRLTGAVLEWHWVRYLSPVVNTYAVIFLVGGAIVSAVRYSRDNETRNRFLGNVFIAVGAILPGIGGSATRMGYVEVLYVTELVGLIIIFFGYRLNVRGKALSVHPAHAVAT